MNAESCRLTNAAPALRTATSKAARAATAVPSGKPGDGRRRPIAGHFVDVREFDVATWNKLVGGKDFEEQMKPFIAHTGRVFLRSR